MRTATLVIDMQLDFFAHQRLAQRRSALAGNINALTADMRAAGGTVIWVRQEFAPDLRDAPLEVKDRGIRVTVAGTPGVALLPELETRPSDRQLVKKRYSAFFGTDLDQVLTRLDCRRLIIAGINTHACIRTTVVDAYQRDYPVILARDCIDSHDAEHHELSWRYMDGKLGRGMSNADIRALLLHESP
ncbi:MAG: cysteine hydrolase [Lysobacteraceae bacterium]|nr:MAG: cysteine hydrolase [Xanthomonadaceae bacterium]